MNWLDFVCIGLISISALIGLVRGFVREVVSLLVWIGAFLLGLWYAPDLAPLAKPYVGSPTLRIAGAFVVLFVGALLLGAVLNYFAGLLVARTGLAGTDRTLGLAFGGLRGVVLIAVLVLLAGLTTIPREVWWRESLIAPRLRPWVCRIGVGDWLDEWQFQAPVISDPAGDDARPAANYWRDFCGVEVTSSGDNHNGG